MQSEIKAAIERKANDYIIEEFPNALEVPHTITFKRGAEYGYKLGLLVGGMKALDGTEYHESWNFYVEKLQELLNEK